MAGKPIAGPWQREELLVYLRKLLITVGVGAVVALAIILKDIWIVAFAAVLASVALRATARRIGKLTRLGPKTSLVIACLLLVVILGGAAWLAWPEIQTQMPNLIDRLQDAITQLQAKFGIQLPDTATEIAQNISGMAQQLFSGAIAVVGTLATVISSILLVLVAGVFMAAEPAKYRQGAILLFPRAWHEKVTVAFDKVGEGLRLWLRAQFMAMVAVGVMIGIGAWIVGLPSPLALGLIAGLGEFVPFIGPFLAVLPAVLVAFATDTTLLVWTIVLYVTVQQFEANLLTPMLQRRIVELPPVLFVFSLVALGIVFGIPGVVVAAPLSVAIYILVREVYVRDLLDEEDLMIKPEAEPIKDTPVTPPEIRQRHRAAEKEAEADTEAGLPPEPLRPKARSSTRAPGTAKPATRTRRKPPGAPETA